MHFYFPERQGVRRQEFLLSIKQSMDAPFSCLWKFPKPGKLQRCALPLCFFMAAGSDAERSQRASASGLEYFMAVLMSFWKHRNSCLKNLEDGMLSNTDQAGRDLIDCLKTPSSSDSSARSRLRYVALLLAACSLSSMAVAALSFSVTAQAEVPYVRIDAEDAYFLPKENPPSYWPGEFFDNNQVFRVYEHGSWHVRPWVCTSAVVNVNGSASSIGFHAVAAPDNNNVADRHELCISQNDDTYALVLNGTRYVAFDFYIDPVSETPRNWTLIAQAWQACETMSPPFSIYVHSDAYNSSYPDATHLILDFIVRDDLGETTIWSTTVEKGTWHNLILQLEPSPLGDDKTGQIGIYFDSQPGDAEDYVWRADWGYAPRAANPFIGTTFDVRVGIYRRKSTRAFSWFVDNIRFGPTKASVEQ
ncbi:MAG: heparin lyase I family protein [Kiritimatiellales bacterium]